MPHLTKIRARLIQKVERLKAFDFEAMALEVFRYQATYNPVYAAFLDYLNTKIPNIHTIEAIPFMPIDFFKKHAIKTGHWQAQQLFRSSGTTQTTPATHHVRALAWYQNIAQKGFEQAYGALDGYCILALLPSYLERQDASLVYMVRHFMEQSGHPDNGFYLNDMAALRQKIAMLQQQNQPTILVGVSFALLDMAEAQAMDLSQIIIMETGGMKGRRREPTRSELHQMLCAAFGVSTIHSEYGMTELLSQAYSKGEGLFEPMFTMKVLPRDPNDPLCVLPPQKRGCLNIIDLANIDTCAFIATDDLGMVHADGRFEVLGRLDHSTLRGCNLMVADL